MNFVMTPPQQEKAKYTMYKPQVSTMRIISDGNTGSGLGDIPAVYSSGGDQQSWVMPVVIIVVSAMALMTLYAVLSKR
jgi:hypothetical protein